MFSSLFCNEILLVVKEKSWVIYNDIKCLIRLQSKLIPWEEHSWAKNVQNNKKEEEAGDLKSIIETKSLISDGSESKQRIS